ncbi:hypothetical protein, partial [uncultured Gammaproteobacteria bacterium]
MHIPTPTNITPIVLFNTSLESCNQTRNIGHYNINISNNITYNKNIEYTPFNKTKKLTAQTPNGSEVNTTTYDANNNRIIQKAYHDTSTST